MCADRSLGHDPFTSLLLHPLFPSSPSVPVVDGYELAPDEGGRCEWRGAAPMELGRLGREHFVMPPEERNDMLSQYHTPRAISGTAPFGSG